MRRGCIHRGARIAPPLSLGARVLLTSATNQQTTTFASAFAPSTGKVLVRILARCNGTGVTSFSTVTLGGTAVTARASAFAVAGSAPIVWIGTATGVATGAALALVVTTNAATGAGKYVVEVSDLIAWGGTVGAGSATLDVTASAKTAIASSITTTGGRLTVGVAGFLQNTATATLSGAGWTDQGGASNSTGANTSAYATFGYRASAAAGGTDTIAGNAASTTATAAAAILELT